MFPIILWLLHGKVLYLVKAGKIGICSSKVNLSAPIILEFFIIYETSAEGNKNNLKSRILNSAKYQFLKTRLLEVDSVLYFLKAKPLDIRSFFLSLDQRWLTLSDFRLPFPIQYCKIQSENCPY